MPLSTSKTHRPAVSAAETERNQYVNLSLLFRISSILDLMLRFDYRFRLAFERHFAQMCDKPLAQKFESWAETYVVSLVSSAKAIFELIHAFSGVNIVMHSTVCVCH